MPRAMWKGIVVFGHVQVPVKLYAAVESHDVGLHLLHDADHARLQQQMVCDLEEKPVPAEEIVKGLAVDDRTYVLVSPEDLAALEPETDRDIRVDCFVSPEEVDPRFYERPYHLGPDGDAPGYAALARALEESGKVGICHWSFRKRSYTGAMGVSDGALSVVTLRQPDEIASPRDLEVGSAAISERERRMADYLIQEMTGTFEPARYRNEYAAALEELIQTKARGGKVKSRRVKAAKPTDAKELVEILIASLDRVKKGRGDDGENGKSPRHEGHHGNGGKSAGAGRARRSAAERIAASQPRPRRKKAGR
jgi:DNA end-binding protein Ku